MALSNETLEQIVSNLTPEEREQLFSQLGRQIKQDKKDISNGKEPLSPTNKTKQKRLPVKTMEISSHVFIVAVPD